MIMKTAFAVSLVLALGFTGATLAHESATAPGQASATQTTPCEGTNGQPTGCEGYHGEADQGRQGAAGVSNIPGPGMMQGGKPTSGQGTGPAQQRGHGMN